MGHFAQVVLAVLGVVGLAFALLLILIACTIFMRRWM